MLWQQSVQLTSCLARSIVERISAMRMRIPPGARWLTIGLLLVSACRAVTLEAKPRHGINIFDRSYVYLVRGDDKYTQFAKNYNHTIPVPDSAFSAEIRPLESGKPANDSSAPQCLVLTLKEPRLLRLIFAEASGSSFAAYEFGNLPAGEYSVGEAAWPKHLSDLIFPQRTVLIYIGVGENFQGRFHFTIDSKSSPVRLTPAPPTPPK